MIDHIEIYVSDLNKSKQFYHKLLEFLGYQKYQEWEQGISFKYMESYIVFVQTEEKYLDAAYHRKHTGLNHLAFRVNSKEKVDAIREKLRALRVHELYSEKYPDAGHPSYACYFEDPNRIKIEVVFRED